MTRHASQLTPLSTHVTDITSEEVAAWNPPGAICERLERIVYSPLYPELELRGKR